MKEVITTPDSNEFHAIVPAPAPDKEIPVEEKLDEKLYKSLSYLNSFQFIEKDDDGLKMRVKREFYGGDFPFETGYVVTSEYDDRQYLVVKTDPENNFLWFGLWEE
jgi:hypothetical protein